MYISHLEGDSSMKQQYEMTREIFNKCSGNQMRDISFEEIEAEPDALQEYAMKYAKGANVIIDRFDRSDEITVFEITADGMKQKITFCTI